MLKNSLLKSLNNTLKSQPKLFINTPRNFISNKRLNTLFDINVDFIAKSIMPFGIKISSFLVALNVGLFCYANFKSLRSKEYLNLEGVSYSVINLKNKDYIPLFASLMGSYRIEDLILESGVLLTVGKSLEIGYGASFMFKMTAFSFYIGLLSSMFWVGSNYAKRSRYMVDVPKGRDVGSPEAVQHKFMSQHGLAMSFVYFSMYKNAQFRMAIPLVLLADMYLWGPYYSSGALTGIAAGMIL